jgi:hypothetical protein
MVHRKSEVGRAADYMSYRVVADIPFEAVPQGFIDQLDGKPYTYKQYLLFCPVYNSQPYYWNVAVFNEREEMVAVAWGVIDPLEKAALLLRISIRPEMFSVKGNFLNFICAKLKSYLDTRGVKVLYGVTPHTKALSRKMGGSVVTLDTRIIKIL